MTGKKLTLSEAKEKISHYVHNTLPEGSGIHGVGMNKTLHTIKLYITPDTPIKSSTIQNLLDFIDNEYELEIISSSQASISW
jgi:hypothetical protein